MSPAGAWVTSTAALLALAAGACGPPASRLAVRAISEDPPPLPDRRDLFVETAREVWPVVDAAPISQPGDSNPPLAELEVDFEASDVQVVEVEQRGLERGSLVLFWRTDHGAGGPDPSRIIQAERTPASERSRLRFEVAGDPRWRGRIERLSLFTESRKRPEVRVSAVRALQRDPDAARIAKISATAWKVSLGRDLRDGFLLPPGTPWTYRTAVFPSSTLRFAYGVEPGMRSAVHFVARSQVDGQAPVEIFRSPAVGAEVASGTWHEAAIKLERWSGKEARISIEAVASGEADPRFGFPLLANPEIEVAGEAPSRPNVLLVSIDTLRADHLSSYGYARSTSPRLDRWAARRAIRYETAIAAAPSTLPSHASMLTGLDAARHGVHHDPLPLELTTLPERLRTLGYRTVALTGGGYVDPSFGFGQGFDTYRSWLWGEHREQELEANVDWAVRWLESRPAGPFFLFLHTYEVHPPFRARTAFRDWNGSDPLAPLLWVAAPSARPESGYRSEHPSRFEYRTSDPSAPTTGQGTTQAAIDRYDSSIAFVDLQVDRLLSALRAIGFEDRTLVVVTSDHGESFGEHGLAGHGYLYEDNLRVPLFIAFPNGRGRGEVERRMVRSIDITPTAIAIAGLPPIELLDGRSLAPQVGNPSAPPPGVAWSYASNSNHGLALRRPNGLEIHFDNTLWPPAFGATKIYDLTADPLEANPLAGDPRESVLRQLVTRQLEAVAPGLRLRLENPTSRAATVLVESTWLSTTRVKGLGSAPLDAEWMGDGDFSLTLTPGEAADLLLEGDAGRSVGVRCVSEGASASPPLSLPALGPGGEARAAYDDRGWRSGEGTAPRCRVLARRVGANATGPSAELSPALELQLRSLGYLR